MLKRVDLKDLSDAFDHGVRALERIKSYIPKASELSALRIVAGDVDKVRGEMDVWFAGRRIYAKVVIHRVVFESQASPETVSQISWGTYKSHSEREQPVISWPFRSNAEIHYQDERILRELREDSVDAFEKMLSAVLSAELTIFERRKVK